MHGAASEAISALMKAAREGAPVTVVHAVVADACEDGSPSIWWVDGIGPVAEVLVSSPKLNGARCRAKVAGDLFSTSTSGALHSRVLRKGDHVVVLLIDGSPDGAALIMGRVPVTSMPPAKESAFRELTEENVTTYVNADVFGKGESWHVQLEDGSYFMRLLGDANFTVNDPAGGSFCYSKASNGWQIKHANGALIQVHGAGVTIKSPGATSWIEVKDSSVAIVSGGTCKVFGKGGLLLNTSPADAPTLPLQACAFGLGGAGVSTSVFVGK